MVENYNSLKKGVRLIPLYTKVTTRFTMKGVRYYLTRIKNKWLIKNTLLINIKENPLNQWVWKTSKKKHHIYKKNN